MFPYSIELQAGPPCWYRRAVIIVLLCIFLALGIAALEWKYSLLVLVVAVLTTCLALRPDQQPPATLCILRQGGWILRDTKGNESLVQPCTARWVTSTMVSLVLRTADGSTRPIVVSRDRNELNAFRRFTVLCRFGFAAEDDDVQNNGTVKPNRSLP